MSLLETFIFYTLIIVLVLPYKALIWLSKFTGELYLMNVLHIVILSTVLYGLS
jgi:hypothetical protein